MKTKAIFPIIIILLLFSCTDLFAQGCVQCRMGPSSNMEGGGSVAKGINSGILYLMFIPYMLIMSIVAYVFRKQLSAKLDAIKAWYNARLLHR